MIAVPTKPNLFLEVFNFPGVALETEITVSSPIPTRIDSNRSHIDLMRPIKLESKTGSCWATESSGPPKKISVVVRKRRNAIIGVTHSDTFDGRFLNNEKPTKTRAPAPRNATLSM